MTISQAANCQRKAINNEHKREMKSRDTFGRSALRIISKLCTRVAAGRHRLPSQKCTLGRTQNRSNFHNAPFVIRERFSPATNIRQVPRRQRDFLISGADHKRYVPGQRLQTTNTRHAPHAVKPDGRKLPERAPRDVDKSTPLPHRTRNTNRFQWSNLEAGAVCQSLTG